MLDIISTFKLYFPGFFRKAVKCLQLDDREVYAELDDGRRVLYDDSDNSIRRLPVNSRTMTERECLVEFGLRLRKIMNNKGISQIELSEKTGISKPVLSLYMNGNRNPGFYNVDKIAKALGCSVDEFRYVVEED